MSLSMYSASVPVFSRILTNMESFLDRAAAWADERKIDHNALLLSRLAPDMFTFTRQVQLALNNNGFTYTFPKHSLTILTFKVQ